MGLTKLLQKAEELATKELEKLQLQQQQQQREQQQRQSGGAPAYAPPTIVQPQQPQQPQAPPPYAPPAGFSTPPPSPPPYGSSVFADRPTTPPAQGASSASAASPSTINSSRGRKKALLIACSYPGTRHQLRGPSNDSQCMQYLLTNKLGFPASQMVVLRDDDVSRGRDFIPYRDVVLRACAWLVADARPGDSLFFHYSGHGSRQKDPTRQEEDGHDGTMLPTDFKQAGQITDTELARIMVHGLPAGVVLHAVFDSCHSGTMLDLPYDTRLDKSGAITPWRRSNMRGTAGGTVIQIGACDDKVTAADTAKLSATAFTGAATYALIQSIEQYGGVNQTYAQLLANMTATLRSLGKSSMKPPTAGSSMAAGALPAVGLIALGPLGLLAGAAMAGGMDAKRMTEQVPVLACDRPIDVHSTTLMI